MVFAAEPDFALLGHIDRAGGLDGVAVLVFGGDHQFNLTGFTQFGFAQQQSACIAFAAADASKVFGFGLVVIGVKTAHHAFAAGGDNARHGGHFQAYICCGLAGQVQRQRLKFDLLIAGHPAFGFDACYHAGWPQR